MGAHAVITHALNQWEADLLAATSVSLVKAGGPVPVPMILVLDSGRYGRYVETVAPFKVNLIKATDLYTHGACAWCCGDETVPAAVVAESPIEGCGVWRDAMCAHHARVYGRFIPVHALRAVEGGAHVEDWGFVETV